MVLATLSIWIPERGWRAIAAYFIQFSYQAEETFRKPVRYIVTFSCDARVRRTAGSREKTAVVGDASTYSFPRASPAVRRMLAVLSPVTTYSCTSKHARPFALWAHSRSVSGRLQTDALRIPLRRGHPSTSGPASRAHACATPVRLRVRHTCSHHSTFHLVFSARARGASIPLIWRHAMGMTYPGLRRNCVTSNAP